MSDDALIEAMARAICDDHNEGMVPMLHSDWEDWKEAAQAALAVARPIIEAQTRERCAKIAEDYFHHPDDANGVAAAIAAAIRSDGDD